MVADWITAGATSVLAVTSAVAVLTWRDNRRRARVDAEREQEQQREQRILDAGRREFAAKDDLSGLRSTLAGVAVVGGILTIVALWDRLFPSKDGG